jgi:hypothetical protein
MLEVTLTFKQMKQDLNIFIAQQICLVVKLESNMQRYAIFLGEFLMMGKISCVSKFYSSDIFLIKPVPLDQLEKFHYVTSRAISLKQHITNAAKVRKFFIYFILNHPRFHISMMNLLKRSSMNL